MANVWILHHADDGVEAAKLKGELTGLGIQNIHLTNSSASSVTSNDAIVVIWSRNSIVDIINGTSPFDVDLKQTINVETENNIVTNDPALKPVNITNSARIADDIKKIQGTASPPSHHNQYTSSFDIIIYMAIVIIAIIILIGVTSPY